MGTIAEKLDYLKQTKEDIKQALINKDVEVSDTDTFRSYADKINSIKTGIDIESFLGFSSPTTITSYMFGSSTSGGFSQYLSITAASFPNVNRVNQHAFSGCKNLSYINFPNCSYISSSAFYSLSGLQEAYCFEKCSFIGSYAFYNCNKISTPINAPLCSTIGASAFQYCRLLSSINVPLLSTLTNNIFLNCNNLETFTMDFSNCLAIPTSAFAGCSKLSQAIFEKCSTILGSAFYGCSSLVNVAFPVCSNIGSYAFANCSNLSNATFPSCTTIGSYAFSNCGWAELTEQNFPLPLIDLSTTTLPTGLFANCKNLSIVSLPISSVTSTLFQGCTKLEEINLPNVTTISTSGFANCGLKTLDDTTFPNCNIFGLYAFASCSQLSKITLSWASVPTAVFMECKSLTELSLPNCQSIGSSAFQSCYGLVNVFLPQCVSLSSNAFRYCSNIDIFNAPVCTSVWIGALQDCTNLRIVNLPLVNYTGGAYGYSVFAGCSSIQELTIGDVSNNIFNGNYGHFNETLKYVKVNNWVSIPYNTFKSCPELETAHFPLCSSSIGSFAFSGCSKLKSLILDADAVPSLWANAFDNTPISDSSYLGYFGSIYVKTSMVEAFKTAANWSTFSDRITSIDNLPNQ